MNQYKTSNEKIYRYSSIFSIIYHIQKVTKIFDWKENNIRLGYDTCRESIIMRSKYELKKFWSLKDKEMQIKNQINISQCTFFKRLLNRLSRLARASADFCVSYLYPQITLIHSHQFIDL